MDKMGSVGGCSAVGRRGPFWEGKGDWGRGIGPVGTGGEKDGLVVVESIYSWWN